MNRYFSKCNCIEDVKARFKELVKQLHPDNGGNAEMFKDMMAEYNIAFNRYKNIHRKASGETYEKATAETPHQFAAVVESLMKIDDISIDLVGEWLWIKGNTYPHRIQLAALGCFWSSGHKCWIYNGDKKRRQRHNMAESEIIEKYGKKNLKPTGTAKSRVEALRG